MKASLLAGNKEPCGELRCGTVTFLISARSDREQVTTHKIIFCMNIFVLVCRYSKASGRPQRNKISLLAFMFHPHRCTRIAYENFLAAGSL